MTDRIHSLIVVLEDDIREDDVEPLRRALLMMRGVLEVGVKVSDINSHMAEARAMQEMRNNIWDALR